MDFRLKSIYLVILTLIVGGFFFTHPASAATTNKSLSNSSLNTGLVGWWTFDGADCGATYCIDKSGQSMSGAFTGGTASSTKIIGKIGQALKMNGVNNWVDIGVTAKPSALNLTGNMTITAWIYSQSSAFAGIVMDMTSLANSSQFAFEINRTANKLSALASGASVALTSNTTLSLNKWYHVALTRSGTTGAWTYTIYLNGVNDGQATTAVNPNTQAGAAIGRGGNWDSGYFKGKIDDVRIYNRALSAQEIQQLYKQGGGKIAQSVPSIQQGLVGWWTFDGADCGASYCLDKSGSGLTGTFSGAPKKQAGKIGQSLKLDATNDYVSLGNVLGTSSAITTMTLSSWIKPTSVAGVQRIINKWVGTGLASGSIIFSNSTAGTLNLEIVADTGYKSVVTTGQVLYPNVWNFVTAVYNAGTVDLYVNGVNVKNSTGNGANIPAYNYNWTFGSSNASTLNRFGGLGDDVRIYNRAFSAQEIKQLYALGGGKIAQSVPSIQQGLVGWWTFDGADINATQVRDKSGQANHGNRTSVTPIAGKVGQAMIFNGTSSILTLTRATLSSGLTYSAWVKTTNSDSTESFTGNLALNLIGDTTGSDVVAFGVENQKVGYYHYNSTWTKTLSNTNMADGKWHLITVTHNSSTGGITLYLDGASDGAGTKTYNTANAGFNVIGKGYNNMDFFDGKVDDIRIYNRVLSAQEIQQLYKMGK